MKLINIECPDCGAGLTVTDNVKSVKCEYCEREFIIAPDDGQIKLSDAERTGYEFEKGRQRAIRELETEDDNFDNEFSYNDVPSYNDPSDEEPYVTERKPKKKHGCLRILLLVFAFVVVFSTFCGSNEKKSSETSNDNNTVAPASTTQVIVPSDDLQKFFMDLSFTISPTDVEDLAKKHNLVFKTLKSSGGTTYKGILNYRIGKTDKEASFSFFDDVHGEYVEIEFDIGKNNSFMNAVYSNEKNTAANVILFKYGYYSALGQHDDTNKEKHGYYYYNRSLESWHFDYEKRPPYEKYNTAKAALERMLTYKQKDSLPFKKRER